MPTFPPTIRIGILVFDGFEPIDVWGFIEPFAQARFLGTTVAEKAALAAEYDWHRNPDEPIHYPQQA